MKKLFNSLGMLLILLLAVSYFGVKAKPRRLRWSHVFVGIAIILLIARVIWVAVKG